ncbi:serine/threonine-protein kinase [Cellulomonas sp. NTE-D12]|uniref:serine/threonine-protein kinase n=1 Tax=Cellulomonas sp. NTE-D12 TaxID=2962632 RepID=UPI00308190CF|nr:serine/threonine protein kinase [Cellulomonas sp. NTE-D12]
MRATRSTESPGGFDVGSGPGAGPDLGTDAVQGTLLAGRYRLGPLLGNGATSDVRLARDERLGREVAVKLLRRTGAGLDGRREQAEARLLASLSHPHLVTVYDAHLDGDQPFFVMELVTGQSLDRRLQQGPLSTDDVRRVGTQVADALAYVHGRGLVHRDVKPGNILLGADLDGAVDARLADFGIARLEDGTRLTATGQLVGTAAYLSPEQVRGAAVGPATDVYALGLVLLEALTGQLVFPGRAVESAVARLHRQPELPAAAGPIGEVLERMTALEPDERPTAAQVAAALAAEDAAGSTATVRLPLPVDAVDEADARAGAPGSSTAVLPVTSAEALAPTRRLDLGGDAGTDRAAVRPPASPSQRQTARRPVGARSLLGGRRPVLLVTVIVALLVIGIAALSATTRHRPPAGTITYPTVSGQLGQDLNRLQQAVRP